MADRDRIRTATVYLQIAPRSPFGGSREWDLAYGREASLRRATNSPPETPIPGCVVVKVKINLPASAWEPLAPEAEVTIPIDAVQRPASVEVEPAGGESRG